MLAKELLDKIKKVTNEILFRSQPEVFKTEKLKDSEVEVKYSELKVGEPVFQSSADGDVAIDNGTYVTDSGVSFTTVDGVITEVLEAQEEELAEEVKEEEAPAEEEKSEEELATEDSEVLQKLAALEQEIADIKAELGKPKEDNTAEFSTLKSDVTAIAELLNAIAKTPAQFSQVDQRNESIDSKMDRLKHLANIISLKN